MQRSVLWESVLENRGILWVHPGPETAKAVLGTAGSEAPVGVVLSLGLVRAPLLVPNSRSLPQSSLGPRTLWT